MRDPFPIPPQKWLIDLIQPLTDAVNLPTLPLHAHEVLFALGFYVFIGIMISPRLSAYFAPNAYRSLGRRTKVNWDVHVVSFIQSVLICILSLYSIFYDEERKELRDSSRWEGRVWEYTGMNGLLQSFALGYFLWDFFMCAYYVNIFGVGMLAHAISAVIVFSFGYRPFVSWYGAIFLLYELSSPFLNIHWFCDKLDLTGSTVQAVNGAFLVATFFGCRLVWGNVGSVKVFLDIYKAIKYGKTDLTALAYGAPQSYTAQDLVAISLDAAGQRTAFAGERVIPVWLGLTYLASNLTLNSLNLFWFGKMIQTIRTRFDPPWGTKGVGPEKIHWEPQEGIVQAAKAAADALHLSSTPEKGSVAVGRKRAEEALNGPIASSEATRIQRAEFPDGRTSVEVSGQRTLRTRRKA